LLDLATIQFAAGDELKQVERRSVQRRVAGAGKCRGECRGFGVEGGAAVGSGARTVRRPPDRGHSAL
jgi:hypothetical protein